MHINKLKLSMVLLLCSWLTLLQAQTLFIREKAGIQTSLELKNISRISFSEGNMTVSKTDGNSGTYLYSNISYLSFSDYFISVSPQILREKSGISLYPNPATDLLQVSYESEKAGSVQIVIFDIHGRLLQKEITICQGGINKYIIRISELPQGIYIFRIAYADKIVTSKFFKK